MLITLLLIIMTFLSLSGKAKAAEPSGPVTYLVYNESGMRYRYEYTYRKDDNGVCTLTRSEGWNNERIKTVTVSDETGEQLWNIIKRYKMYNYKSSYTPNVDIRDGQMWHLQAEFSKGNRLFTGGDNAWPDNGKGIQALEQYLDKLWNSFPQQVEHMEYRETGSTVFPLCYFILEKNSETGQFWLTNASNCPAQAARKIEVPQTFLDELARLVCDEKMHDYQRDYRPPYQVLDGRSWTLYIRLSNTKTSIYSSGYESFPEGEGLQKLEKLCCDIWQQLESTAIPAPIE